MPPPNFGFVKNQSYILIRNLQIVEYKCNCRPTKESKRKGDTSVARKEAIFILRCKSRKNYNKTNPKYPLRQKFEWAHDKLFFLSWIRIWWGLHDLHSRPTWYHHSRLQLENRLWYSGIVRNSQCGDLKIPSVGRYFQFFNKNSAFLCIVRPKMHSSAV